jgi:CRISPR-associated endonuclease/helicase Cas3
MSATITEDQEKAFLENRPNALIIRSSGGLEDISMYPRYRFHLIQREDAGGLFQASQKTLWIVNRVRVCQDIGREFGDCDILHSYYPHKDRLLFQEKLIKAFRSRGPAFAVTTQIAQLSLDISSGRLISEICPMSDFVQRTGRAGERGKIPKRLTDIFFYMPERDLPYHEKLENLLPWYKELERREAWSLHDLVLFFKESSVNEVPTDVFEERPMMQTFPMLTRDPDGKITALLEKDLPDIQVALEKAKYDGRVVANWDFTLYPPKNLKSLSIFKGRAVVPYTYDPRLGVLIPRRKDLA